MKIENSTHVKHTSEKITKCSKRQKLPALCYTHHNSSHNSQHFCPLKFHNRLADKSSPVRNAVTSVTLSLTAVKAKDRFHSAMAVIAKPWVSRGLFLF